MLTLLAVTVESVGGWLASVLIGTGVLWALLMLLVRGFWEKTGKPAVKETILAINSAPDASAEREKEIKKIVENWHNAPDQIGSRRKFIEGVLDDAVVRTDGIVYKDTTSKIQVASASVAQQVSKISDEIRAVQKSVADQGAENRAAQASNLEKINKIEGGIEVLLAHMGPETKAH